MRLQNSPGRCLRLEEMLPAELDNQIARNPLVILPFGTIEWHSHHLPVGLDSLKAQAVCERVAEQTGAVLAPPTYWAVGGVPFPHTLRFRIDLIETLANEIFRQLATMGFRVMVAVTGHYGLEQVLALKRAALDCMRASNATVFAVGEYEVVTDRGYHGDHAAKWETSLLWAIRPDLVRLAEMDATQPLPGVIGEDPRGTASQSLGLETFKLITDRLSELCQRFVAATTAVQRWQYMEAIAAGVRVLERLAAERAGRPRSQVPPLATPAYLDYLDAIYRGDYAAAQRHAENKWVDLSN